MVIFALILSSFIYFTVFIDHIIHLGYKDQIGHLIRKAVSIMKTMPAAEAKTNFGALLDTVQREPVTISKQGRPVAVMMSIQEFKEHEALKLERLRWEVRKGLDQLDQDKSLDGRPFMKSLLQELG